MEIQKLREYTAGMSLLVVEDSKSMQALSHELLSKVFDDIDMAENGEEGLAMYQSKWHDIVITDINMPVMDGIEMLKRIKEIDWDQSVIIFSAYDSSINLVELINLNTSHFLKKPVSYKNMLNVIYPIAKRLYIERKASRLEQKIEEHDAEMKMVMDLIDNGIVILNKDSIEETNQKFLEFTGSKKISSATRLDDFFAEKEGYLSGLDNGELLNHLLTSDDLEHKVMIPGEAGDDGEGYFQVTCRKISAREKFILSFTDITKYEKEAADLKRHIYTDPLTGLPNRTALLKKIMMLKKPQRPVEIVALSANNFDHIAKFYGEDVKKESEKYLQDQIESSLDASGILPKVYYGSYDKNRFLFITHQKLIPKLLSAINGINVLYTYKRGRPGGVGMESFSILLAHKRVPIPHLLQKGHVIKKIDHTFTTLCKPGKRDAG
jgi:CheY-like chemotaxis protein